MMNRFQPTDLWADFLEAAWTRNLQLGDEISKEQCSIWTYGASLSAVTIEDAASQFAGRDGQKLSLWGLLYVGDLFPTDLRHYLISCVTQDPPIASIAYAEAPDLTYQEKVTLWNSFCDVLPVTVAKLEAPDA